MFKRKLGMRLVIAVLFAATSAFAAPDLLVNGNFSSGLAGWEFSDNVFSATHYWDLRVRPETDPLLVSS